LSFANYSQNSLRRIFANIVIKLNTVITCSTSCQYYVKVIWLKFMHAIYVYTRPYEMFRKPSEDNSVTNRDVTTRVASSSDDMPAAVSGSAKRPSAQRKPISHRSTPNIAAACQTVVETRRSNGRAVVDVRPRATSASRGHQSAAAATNEIGSRHTDKSASRSVTSHDVSRATTKTTASAVRRSSIPTPSSLQPMTGTSPRPASDTGSAPTSPRQLAHAGPPTLQTTSKKLCRSAGNLSTISTPTWSPRPKPTPSLSPTLKSTPSLSPPPPKSTPSVWPPPKHRILSNIGRAASVKSSPAVATVPRHHSDSKPVVISGRGSRAQAAAATAVSVSPRDGGGGKKASMRSRIGIAPNLLLPNCYQPGKTTSSTPARSFSIDATIPTSPRDVAASHVAAVATPPRIRRSLSVEEPYASPSPLPPKTAPESYPEPPPEDRELNSRMEMLFEEYRKVERGLIFSDEQSPRQDASVSNCSATSQSKSVKSSAGGATETVPGGRRGGQIASSPRAKSVGNLSSSHVSAQQPQSDRTVRATGSGTSMSISSDVSMTSNQTGGSRTHHRGQSSPRTERRFVQPPATPPPSRKSALSNGMTASCPRQQTGTGKVAAACRTDMGGPAPTGLRQTRSCGVDGMTRVRRDSLPSSLLGTSLRVGSTTDNGCPRVDATKHSQRRSSTPSFSMTTTGHRCIKHFYRAMLRYCTRKPCYRRENRAMPL